MEKFFGIVVIGCFSLAGTCQAGLIVSFDSQAFDGIAQHTYVSSNGGPVDPFDAQTGLSITSPFAAYSSGTATKLTGVEALNSVTGAEVAPNFSGPSTVRPAAAGTHDLGSLTSLVDNSRALYVSFSGFGLDVNSNTDYVFDTTSNVETRIFRNGVLSLHQTDGVDFFEVVKFQQVVLEVSIFWDNVVSAGSPQVLLQSAARDSLSGLSVQLASEGLGFPSYSGLTSSGPYGVFTPLSFELDFVHVVNPNTLSLFLVLVGGVFGLLTKRSETSLSTQERV